MNHYPTHKEKIMFYWILIIICIIFVVKTHKYTKKIPEDNTGPDPEATHDNYS